MKKLFQFGWLLSVALLATACSDAVRPFVGDFSYKISGTVTIDGSITHVLPTEQGCLQLDRIDKNTVLMTFNALGGGVYTDTGYVDNSHISFSEAERTLLLTYTNESSQQTTQYFDLTVAGEGDIQNETIVFRLTYEGEGLKDGSELVGENILMVAKQN